MNNLLEWPVDSELEMSDLTAYDKGIAAWFDYIGTAKGSTAGETPSA
jgi:hypothetical protein